MNANAFGAETFLHELRNIDIFPWQYVFAALDDVDLNAEPAQRLAELTTDRAAAQHDHALRFFLQLIENGFVCEIRDFLYAVDFRNCRVGAGGDHEISCAQFLSVHFDFGWRNKPRFSAKNIYAERLEAFLRIVRRDFGTTRPHPLKNFFESKLR